MRNLFSKINWHVVAYAMLTAVVIYTLHQERAHSNMENHNQKMLTQEIFHRLKTNTQSVLVQQCKRGNKLRVSLKNITLGFIPEVRAQEHKHLISVTQADASIKEIRSIAKQIGPVNCISVTNLNTLYHPAHK